ncbi:MAG: ribosome biogenesis GTP-binding protein YihA/YsxC [Spirochaetes bacterium]|nr:ribosome biogenesis GTP-binding protein YihA/YsxC [Spirochaetota bacterium]
MKINQISFYKSFVKAADIGETRFPEIAFIGRSNVGKSSLINHLCKKKIAHTSSTPGKTRLINLFLVNNKFYLVDLPGYGYAKVDKKMRKDWGKSIEDYLISRQQLKAVFFLLDCRRVPNEHDRMINEWLKKNPGVQTFYVLTKADKFSKSKLQQQKVMIAKELFVDLNEFVCYSVTKNIGKHELLNKLANCLENLD